jgi:hypothetical protein
VLRQQRRLPSGLASVTAEENLNEPGGPLACDQTDRAASLKPTSSPPEGDPMSSRTIAGAVALLAAPVIVIAGTLTQPTLSGDAATQVAALTGHRGAMITALALSSVAVVLLIAGVIWLALALAPRAPRLAVAGGVLGVFGLLVVLFENSVLDRIHSGAALTALEPLSITGDIGLALLGIAAVKAGAPRWAGAAIVVGALAEGAGFATGTRAVVIIAFAVLFLGLLQAVRTLAASPSPRLAAAGAQAAAVS